MAAGKVVSFCSEKAGVGRRMLVRSLAQHWAEQEQNVLVVQLQNPPYHEDPASWVPKFMLLSPLLLRNFLAGPRGSYGRLNLPRLPEPALLKELIGLLASAYAWILVVGPRDLSPQALSILDASDLLLWISNMNSELSSRFQIYLDQLTKLHFPHTFVHAIINR